MNYLNPHTHDLNSDNPKGYWIARPDCLMAHDPYANGLESPGVGFRDRGEGYDHEHYEPIPRTMSGPAQRKPDGTPISDAATHSFGPASIRDEDDEPAYTPPADVMPRYGVTITFTDAEENTILHAKAFGYAECIADTADALSMAFRSHTER